MSERQRSRLRDIRQRSDLDAAATHRSLWSPAVRFPIDCPLLTGYRTGTECQSRGDALCDGLQVRRIFLRSHIYVVLELRLWYPGVPGPPGIGWTNNPRLSRRSGEHNQSSVDDVELEPAFQRPQPKIRRRKATSTCRGNPSNNYGIRTSISHSSESSPYLQRFLPPARDLPWWYLLAGALLSGTLSIAFAGGSEERGEFSRTTVLNLIVVSFRSASHLFNLSSGS